MIIEIDGFFTRALLTGRECSKQELERMYLQTEKLTYEPRDFSHLFCRLHNFEQISYSKDIEVDFVLDTDTGRIYSPGY